MHRYRRAAYSFLLFLLFVFPAAVEDLHSIVHHNEEFCHALYEHHFHAPMHHCQMWTAAPMSDSFIDTPVISPVIRRLAMVYDTRCVDTEINRTFNHISFRAPPVAGF